MGYASNRATLSTDSKDDAFESFFDYVISPIEPCLLCLIVHVDSRLEEKLHTPSLLTTRPVHTGRDLQALPRVPLPWTKRQIMFSSPPISIPTARAFSERLFFACKPSCIDFLRHVERRWLGYLAVNEVYDI